jgi:hypothetical protein
MKKSIFLFSALAVMAFSDSFAQEASKKVKSRTAKKTAITPKVEAPKLETAGMTFEQETIDYGNVEFKSDGGREFVFVNNGAVPLIISNCVGSCGCTVPTWTREPIAPGAKGVIAVKYDTARPGGFTKTITVTANIAETAKVLTIKGNVLPDPNAAPAGTIVPEGQTKI